MNDIRSENKKEPLPKRLLKLLIGLTALVIFYMVIASGYTPPGICGEVLRHNQANHIDASPLIYTEVEHMSDLEEGVKILRESAEGLHYNPAN